MPEMEVLFTTARGTATCDAQIGATAITMDRPLGKARGTGRGLNGGQLLAAALGGCFCNDVYYVADTMGIDVRSLRVRAVVTFDGEPLRAVRGRLVAAVDAAADDDVVEQLIARAAAISTVAGSVAFPVNVERIPI